MPTYLHDTALLYDTCLAARYLPCCMTLDTHTHTLLHGTCLPARHLPCCMMPTYLHRPPVPQPTCRADHP
eukprot:1141387-Pelagomonas_calceolata.AAC.3